MRKSSKNQVVSSSEELSSSGDELSYESSSSEGAEQDKCVITLEKRKHITNPIDIDKQVYSKPALVDWIQIQKISLIKAKLAYLTSALTLIAYGIYCNTAYYYNAFFFEGLKYVAWNLKVIPRDGGSWAKCTPRCEYSPDVTYDMGDTVTEQLARFGVLIALTAALLLVPVRKAKAHVKLYQAALFLFVPVLTVLMILIRNMREPGDAQYAEAFACNIILDNIREGGRKIYTDTTRGAWNCDNAMFAFYDSDRPAVALESINSLIPLVAFGSLYAGFFLYSAIYLNRVVKDMPNHNEEGREEPDDRMRLVN